ncbi:MAG: tetratricopeptide repeat protein, partial [Emcibacteraceae bacterium]|nr:tetratricopeptide repeat protein [Emcibacteraceae bacterium]
QEIMNAEEVTDAGYREVLEILGGQRLDRLNPAEQLSYYNFSAAAEQNLGNMNGALGHYKSILAMDTISYTMRDQMVFIVGQIEFSNSNYDEAIKHFYEWLKYAPNPSMTQIVMFANIHYSIAVQDGIAPAEAEKNFRSAAEFLNWAIAKAKADGKEDKEAWYALLRAIHNNLDEMDKALEYTELLATRWPKKDYWVQLSGLYAQKSSDAGLSEDEAFAYEKKQMVAFELLHRQNLLDSGRELESMSQLYLYHESPFQSAKVMKKSIDEGLSDSSYKNMNILSIALMNGKDFEQSIAPLTSAAELSENGNGYIQLANILLNLDRYEEATEAIDKGIEKGGVRRADQSRLLQGQAYLSLERFDEAREAFREAARVAQDERSKRGASQLLRYTDSEERRIKDIREYLS